MDLKEFTKETLTQIIEGVKAANTQMEASGAFVPSSNLSSIGEKHQYSNKDGYDHHVINIDFDVAVSVSESKENNKGGALRILDVASLGGENNKSYENTSFSRIKFSIPLALPNEKNPVKKSHGPHMSCIK